MAPLLVLVPGAFGTAECFKKMVPHLEGLDTHPGEYPSCDPKDPSSASCSNDSKVLRDTLLSLLEKGRDLVVLAHSYGGIVAAGAVKDLDRETRKGQGHETAVLGLIYIAANITLEGQSLKEAVGGHYPGFIHINKPSEGLVLLEPAEEIFYHDCWDPEFADWMKPHALAAFETKAPAPGWKDRGFDQRRLYIRTTNDRSNPVSSQDKWRKDSGVEWKVITFETGHMPFLGREKEKLASDVIKFVDEISRL